MYLHLSRNLSIHAGDVVAIVNLTGRQGCSVCQHCGLPLVASTGYRKRPGAAWSSQESRSLPCRSRERLWSGAIRSACTRQGMYSKMFDFTV